MDSTLPLVSLICSIRGDDETLPQFHGALFRVLRALERAYRFEILYVGAGDRAGVDALAQLDPRIRALPAIPADPSDSILQADLEHATGSMVVALDADAHPPDVIPRLLELAQGPCALVEGAPPESRPSPWFLRLFPSSKAAATPTLVLLKGPALAALRASGHPQRLLSEAVRAMDLPRAKLAYAPNVRSVESRLMPLRRLIADVRETWQRAPLALVAYFGGTMFIVGVFLTVWFTVQGMIAPGSVWFSWCYLIVLLHILGGSILFALGKLGALASRILERVQERAEPVAPSIPTAAGNPSIVPLTRSRDAA